MDVTRRTLHLHSLPPYKAEPCVIERKADTSNLRDTAQEGHRQHGTAEALPQPVCTPHPGPPRRRAEHLPSPAAHWALLVCGLRPRVGASSPSWGWRTPRVPSPARGASAAGSWGERKGERS